MHELVPFLQDGLKAFCLALLACIGAGWGACVLARVLMRGFGRRGLTSLVLLLCAVVATFIGGGKGNRSGGGAENAPAARRTPDREAGAPPPPSSAFRISAIALANDACDVTAIWTNGLFEAGTLLDFVVKTNLLDETWTWSGAETVAATSTTTVHSVALSRFSTAGNGLGDVAHLIPPTSLFVTAVPRLPPPDLRDSDRDGLPDLYECHNGTNPWVRDRELAAHRVVVDEHADLQAAIDGTTAYSVVELEPGTYEGRGGLGVRLPDHPILLAGGAEMPVIRSPGFATFILPSNTTERTIIRNLYIDQPNDGLQVGFWCGGNLPWVRRSASATFENVHLRFSNPAASCYGWLFYGTSTNRTTISRCTVNAQGASRVRGIYAVDPPPLDVGHSTFVNFPASSSTNTSAAVLLDTRAEVNATNEAPIRIHDCVFDASFANAEIVARLGQPSNACLTVENSILPREPRPEALAATASLWITNAGVTAWGYPQADFPAARLRLGALPVLDPTSATDTDGDGLTDWEEAYRYGTSPILRDSDGDRVEDGVEVAHGAYPNDPESYCCNLACQVTNEIPSLAYLRCALFTDAERRTPASTVHALTNAYDEIDFGHVLVTNGVNPVVRIWRDVNTNDCFDVNEYGCTNWGRVTGHDMLLWISVKDRFLEKDGEGIPTYWWVENGFTNAADRVATADPDGDGLINLHEYWAGTHPLQPDGSNTLLSVLSRSVDDRIRDLEGLENTPLFANVFTNGYHTNFTLNSSCWLNGVDLSCCNIWCEYPDGSPEPQKIPTQARITLVGPRHVVYANHFDYGGFMATNKIYFFRGRSGTIYPRILKHKRGVVNDIGVGILNDNLPTNDVSYAQILPSASRELICSGKYVPEFIVASSLNAFVQSLREIDWEHPNVICWGRSEDVGRRSSFAHPDYDTAGGMSSSPRFLLLGDQPILLGTLWKWDYHWNYGSCLIHLNKSELEDKMRTLPEAGEFSFKEIDLDSFLRGRQ